MKQMQTKESPIQILTYENGKYQIKFDNLDIPVTIDEKLYKNWIGKKNEN